MSEAEEVMRDNFIEYNSVSPYEIMFRPLEPHQKKLAKEYVLGRFVDVEIHIRDEDVKIRDAVGGATYIYFPLPDDDKPHVRRRVMHAIYNDFRPGSGLYGAMQLTADFISKRNGGENPDANWKAAEPVVLADIARGNRGRLLGAGDWRSWAVGRPPTIEL